LPFLQKIENGRRRSHLQHETAEALPSFGGRRAAWICSAAQPTAPHLQKQPLRESIREIPTMAVELPLASG